MTGISWEETSSGYELLVGKHFLCQVFESEDDEDKWTAECRILCVDDIEGIVFWTGDFESKKEAMLAAQKTLATYAQSVMVHVIYA